MAVPALLLASPLATWAQETATAAAPLAENGDMTWALIKMIGGLAAVLALLMFLVWAMKRFGPARMMSGGSRMRVLGRLSLGGRKWLMLVEVGGKVLLVGVGETGVNLLTTIDDPQQVGNLTRTAGGFTGALKRASDGDKESDQ